MSGSNPAEKVHAFARRHAHRAFYFVQIVACIVVLATNLTNYLPDKWKFVLTDIFVSTAVALMWLMHEDVLKIQRTVGTIGTEIARSSGEFESVKKIGQVIEAIEGLIKHDSEGDSVRIDYIGHHLAKIRRDLPRLLLADGNTKSLEFKILAHFSEKRPTIGLSKDAESLIMSLEELNNNASWVRRKGTLRRTTKMTVRSYPDPSSFGGFRVYIRARKKVHFFVTFAARHRRDPAQTVGTQATAGQPQNTPLRSDGDYFTYDYLYASVDLKEIDKFDDEDRDLDASACPPSNFQVAKLYTYLFKKLFDNSETICTISSEKDSAEYGAGLKPLVEVWRNKT